MYSAIEGGNLQIIELLLSRGADVNEKDKVRIINVICCVIVTIGPMCSTVMCNVYIVISYCTQKNFDRGKN